MQLYNTSSRKVENFQPLSPPDVSFYSCGPTVYDYTHIGHIRTFINNDSLKRALLYLGYSVNHVMNITDVGHLTGDDDTGEDKLEKGAEKTGKTVWEVATFYTDFFMRTIRAVNIMLPNSTVKATDHIKDMIKMIQKLEEEGFAYQTDEAVYFDTSKFKDYGKLSGQKLEHKKQQARKDVHVDEQKRNPTDFALWFKRVGRFANHHMHWPSPWSEGFPGWHIECSTISMTYLGETIDIHSGGVDHIPVHHENEIAQSEAATGKPFVRFWFHNEFLLIDGQKMSKSLGNIYTIDDLEKEKINPLALRLLFLQTHYRQQMNFTWDSAKAAQEAYKKLTEQVILLKSQTKDKEASVDKAESAEKFRDQFKEALESDLQMPQAVAMMWKMLKSDIPPAFKLEFLFEFDKVLGLNLASIDEHNIPEDVQQLAQEREDARKDNNFAKADELRKILDEKGYVVDDSDGGFRVKKKT